MELRLTTDELTRLVRSSQAVDDIAAERGGTIVVTGGAAPWPTELPPLLPLVVVHAVETGGPELPATAADVVASPPDVERIVEATRRCPQATAALVTLLRGGATRAVAAGLVAESATYGVLQSGEEFAAWRATRARRGDRRSTGDPVAVTRRGDVLTVELAAPEVRNALDVTMRDALAGALEIALHDPTVRVELRGAGACFCSGGYLDEFGTRLDPATAHLVRLARSLGWMVHRLAERMHVSVHGPCRGSGVELPAFAGRVTADPDASFGLPEIGMGLIPGAGGTVSLPRRIGRQRTAWLALTGAAIDATTALEWGLVDALATR